MADSVKVSWSGGKDSTAAVLLHLQAGHEVTAVCYVPMFDHETPLIRKAHYEFILETAQRFRAMGADVRIVSGMTYCEYCTHVSLKGKFKGQIFGFPCFKRSQCGFKRDSKLKALNSEQIVADYEDIGIAADETARFNQLTASKRSILKELRITEKEARRICLDNGMLSPLYFDGGSRDGCCLCPHAKEEERIKWFTDYPGVRHKLLQLQNYVIDRRPDRLPLRNNRLFLEG